MQRSTDGTPAEAPRRALAWQYWQEIWYEPAWITWLKKIGCTGPWRVVATGSTPFGSNLGSARVRTYAMTSAIWMSERYGAKFGMSGDSPTDCAPCAITLCRKWSGSAFRIRPSVRSCGLIGRFWPATPSPLPSAPWQVAQYWSKVALPRAIGRGSGPSCPPPWAAAFSPLGPEAGVVADLATEIGNPIRMPISTAAMAALPTTADRAMRMGFDSLLEKTPSNILKARPEA